MSSMEFSRLRKVNKIMMITLWCIVAFQTVFSLFLVDDPNVFKIVIPGLLCLALTVTILHVRKVFVGGIKYIMVVARGLSTSCSSTCSRIRTDLSPLIS